MSFIILMLALVGIVWSLVFALRGSLYCGLVVYLICACCLSGRFWSVDAAGFTWSMDRFVLALLIVVFAVRWAMGRIVLKPFTHHEGLLAGFVALLFVSTFTHEWRAMGPDNESPLIHLINGYMIPGVIFFMARHASIGERELHLTYGVFGLFGLYLVATAICEISGQWAFVVPRYIADPNVGIHFGRARGPMLQSVRLGTYLLFCAAATTALVCGLRTRKWWMCALAALLAPLYLLAIYFTYTRSVWMGAALILLVGVGFTLRGRWRVFLFATAFASALVVMVAKGDQLVAFKRETSAADTRDSTYMRASFAYVSWKMFQDKPLTGFGFRQFQYESQYYLDDRTTALQLEQIRGYIHHNTVLSLLVELGFMGPILFLGILAAWAGSAAAIWRDPSNPRWVRAHGLLFLAVLSAYSLQLVFREVSYSPIENSLLFLAAGITCSLSAEYVRGRGVHFAPSTALSCPSNSAPAAASEATGRLI